MHLDAPLPGQAVPLRPRSPPPPMVAWWKEQLDAVPVPQGNAAAGSRHRRRHDDYDSDASDVSMHSAKSLRDEADELREALRAARRQLDAGERRERALRRALKQNDLLPGEASPERRQQQRPTQPPIGQGGMLDQVLLQSGLLHTEEGRLQIAQPDAQRSAAASPGRCNSHVRRTSLRRASASRATSRRWRPRPAAGWPARRPIQLSTSSVQ